MAMLLLFFITISILSCNVSSAENERRPNLNFLGGTPERSCISSFCNCLRRSLSSVWNLFCFTKSGNNPKNEVSVTNLSNYHLQPTVVVPNVAEPGMVDSKSNLRTTDNGGALGLKPWNPPTADHGVTGDKSKKPSSATGGGHAEEHKGSDEVQQSGEKSLKPETLVTGNDQCYVEVYKGVQYNVDYVYDKTKGAKNVNTFDDCISQCLTLYVMVCSGVNFRESDKYCSLHTSAIIKGETTDGSYNHDDAFVHAYIKCKEPEVSAPIKCGLQADEYKPTILAPNHRIIGGKYAKAHSWPWHVIIFGFFEGKYAKECGGVIICDKKGDDCDSTRMVVTIAGCLTLRTNDDGTRVKVHGVHVLAGKHDLNIFEYGEQIRVSTEFEIDGISDVRYDLNNIAVIILDKPLIFTKTVRHICLPRSTLAQYPSLCVTSGFGRTNRANKKVSNILKQLLTPILQTKKCMRANYYFNQGSILCAGHGDGRSGACEQDSGGPLQCQEKDKWTLYGLVGWFDSDQCPEDNAGTHYYRVSFATRWWLDV